MASSSPTVEDRLAALEHRAAIADLKHRYFRAADSKDPEALRACFATAGARIDYGPLGRFDDIDELVEVFRKVALHRVDGKAVVLDMHHGMHPQITLTGADRDTGRWTLRYRRINLVERTELVLTGDYDDDYLLEGDGWKIAASRFRPLWSLTRPLGDDVTVTEGR